MRKDWKDGRESLCEYLGDSFWAEEGANAKALGPFAYGGSGEVGGPVCLEQGEGAEMRMMWSPGKVQDKGLRVPLCKSHL